MKTCQKDFASWYEMSHKLDEMMKEASAELQKFPKGQMGLTPDEVKKDPKYKKAKAHATAVFQAIRQNNTGIPKDWARKACQIRRNERARKNSVAA